MKTREYIMQLCAADRDAWITECREIRAAANALKKIYSETVTGKPADTLDQCYAAIGEHMTKVIIASLINQSAWDGRISKRAIVWANTIDDAYDKEASDIAWLYCENIHRAHLDQLACEIAKRG